LTESGLEGVSYRVVELSGELRERQRWTLAERVPAALEHVEWLDALPDRIEGVVLGNELLDALPVRLFQLFGGEVFERGVTCARSQAPGQFRNGSARPGADLRFVFADRPADPDFSAAVRALLDDSGWASQGGWPDGYVSEFGEQAAAWVESVSRRLAQGALLLIDYGFPRAEFFHPQRSRGTLMCHYRHHSHDDPFWLPGLQDITAHVDFSAIDTAARTGGLELLGYCSQASFLLDCGLPGIAMREPQDDVLRWARQASALQRLMSEAEMGELFKAIAFGRGIPDDAIGFMRGDRRHALVPGKH
jgi:SAM-dependent MidA family methyltransferase